jgi:hypothetical protein
MDPKRTLVFGGFQKGAAFARFATTQTGSRSLQITGGDNTRP